MTMMASKHGTPGLPSPPTAIWRKPDINDKEQQIMEPEEMDFSMTVGMRFGLVASVAFGGLQPPSV
jgi:hypothetical protein